MNKTEEISFSTVEDKAEELKQIMPTPSGLQDLRPYQKERMLFFSFVHAFILHFEGHGCSVIPELT